MLPESSLDFQFVLIDLTTSNSISHMDTEPGADGLGADTSLMEVVLGEELDEAILDAWLPSPNGKRMQELFAMRAHELVIADP